MKVGDKIRILEDGLDGAWVSEGDVFAVVELVPSSNDFRTEAPRHSSSGTWRFGLEDEGTGWEKYEGEK